MKIYVVRHGETEENTRGIMQGNMDTLLDANGRCQAMMLRDKVKKANIDLIITSPKLRTKETALLAAPGVKMIEDERLLSRNHGEFEGMSRNQVDLEGYWNVKKNIQYRKAESVVDMFDRVISLLDEIKEKYSDKNVLICTHSGIVRILYYYFNGIPESGDLLGYESTNCSFEEYELN